MVMCHPRGWEVTWFPMVTCAFSGSRARRTNIVCHKVLGDLDAFEQRVPADSSTSEQPLYERTRQINVIETGDSTCCSKVQVDALIYC